MQACFHIAGVTCPNCAYYPQDRSVVTFTQTYEMPQSKFKPENHITGKVYDLTQENMTALILAFEKLSDENARLREALEFTLKAAEHLYRPDKPLHGDLDPTFYYTLSYEGDLELIEKTKQARAALGGEMTESEILEAAASRAPMHTGTSAYKNQWIKAFTAGAQFALHKLEAENARLREALKAIAVAEGRENYPQELWAALLMDKARGALLEVK